MRRARGLWPAGRNITVWLVGVALVVAGVGSLFAQPAPTTPRGMIASTFPASDATSTQPAEPPPLLVDPRGEPVRIVITSASLGVLADASVVDARLAQDGRLIPPAGRVGWLADTGWPRPGVQSRYRSIMTGHVSANGLPDVFSRLADAQVGDKVEIEYDSGEVVYLVIAVAPISVGKTTVTSDHGFDWVWESPNKQAERIVSLFTCNPNSEHTEGHSVDNWVAQATVVSVDSYG